ncbi:MAG: DUF3341 domain-containing protein [Bacteroidetes bacterium]|jgi:hypothetical protein|nr:DUF3341 domain-containing protein [Bacteroidota bacterium]
MANKNVIFGLYDDEKDLLSAVKVAKSQHLEIMDVFSPFPVHGLDPILGLKESRLHIVGFIFGLIGTITAFGFMTWALSSDWPIIYGGKPYWPVPSFIPVTFELTVLFASIGMVVTFYTVCGMGPGVTNPTLHDRITDDKFCVAFELEEEDETDRGKYEDYFESTGASLVDTKKL